MKRKSEAVHSSIPRKMPVCRTRIVYDIVTLTPFALE